MNAEKTINVEALVAEAESSEHKEAYTTLNRAANFRIGIGARIASPNRPSFFIEILIHLSHDSNEADLHVLEKSLALLKALQARGFKTVFQGDNWVSCEAQVSNENLTTEYEWATSLVQSVFVG